jgi:hypothetical protein
MSVDSSDLSGSSSGSSSGGPSSDIDEQAIMDQIEFDLYRGRIARAWEIVNRRQAELSMESDSEISALASSLFNSTEGIETGSAELGEIEWAALQEVGALQVKMARTARTARAVRVRAWKMQVTGLVVES